ncbi:MAG: hypothetical protein OEW58_12925 [Gammaproteobacteria bacterium]|nr:hypothetical protein [Gammaproteobacteria bacterium]
MNTSLRGVVYIGFMLSVVLLGLYEKLDQWPYYFWMDGEYSPSYILIFIGIIGVWVLLRWNILNNSYLKFFVLSILVSCASSIMAYIGSVLWVSGYSPLFKNYPEMLVVLVWYPIFELSSWFSGVFISLVVIVIHKLFRKYTDKTRSNP